MQPPDPRRRLTGEQWLLILAVKEREGAIAVRGGRR
jgi:hypothetical protein